MTGSKVSLGLTLLLCAVAGWVLSPDAEPSTGMVLPDVVQTHVTAQDIKPAAVLPQLTMSPHPTAISIAPEKPSESRVGLLPDASYEPKVALLRAIEATRASALPAPLMTLPPDAEPRTLPEAIEMARTAQDKTSEYLGSAAMNPFASTPK